MNKGPITSTLTAAALLTMCYGLAAAQQSEMVMEEIVVVAPRIVRREAVGRTPAGSMVERIALTRSVNYADLDLTRHADVQELERRVGDMAQEACTLLAELFPLADPGTPDCARDAMRGANAQVRAAIDAAISGDAAR